MRMRVFDGLPREWRFALQQCRFNWCPSVIAELLERGHVMLADLARFDAEQWREIEGFHRQPARRESLQHNTEDLLEDRGGT